ncbi:hypothetical protein EPK99_04125 [Neorhizobium lilium]|uniref:Uncharacterized protein n=1 Tax=Neorhizobium lilium TaxID=2503024 RepID=A0A3S3RPT5_9HYPH|nr:hypothetical protein [Neorhizobium lilium]RWX81484.1 hypothetical protein EPK99_04125 [Neorhizobium lilium]
MWAPDRSKRGLRPGSFNEFRRTKAPIVRYKDNRVKEIEAFYDLESVTFQKSMFSRQTEPHFFAIWRNSMAGQQSLSALSFSISSG